jgi:hypothetical protein
MAVLKALRQTPVALLHNPIVFVPILVLILLQLPQLLLQAVDPLLASVVSLGISLLLIVLVPFFQGGIIGMADEALEGKTSLGSFVREGRSNYVSFLVVYLVILALNFAVGIFGFFVLVFGGLALFAGGAGGTGGGPGIAVLAVVGLVVGLFVLAYLVFALFVQFYGQAIVVDDLGAVEGIKRSVSVVRTHFVSTLGYSVLVGVIGLLAGGVFALATALVSTQSATSPAHVPIPHLSPAAAVGVGLAVLALGTLFGGFFGVYSVAFYREIAPPVDGSA